MAPKKKKGRPASDSAGSKGDAEAPATDEPESSPAEESAAVEAPAATTAEPEAKAEAGEEKPADKPSEEGAPAPPPTATPEPAPPPAPEPPKPAPAPAPAPAPEEEAAEDGPGLTEAMSKELEALAALLARAEGLAEFHACGTAAAPEDEPPLPPPLADAPLLDGDGAVAEYLSLEDGALVGGRSLLVGPRRGQRYLSVEEAAERRWANLTARLAAGAPQAEALASAFERAQGAAAAWVSWKAVAAQRVDEGFDQLEAALKIQRQAAHQALERNATAAEAVATTTAGRLRALWAAEQQQQRALRVCAARTGRDAGEGWEARLCAAWTELQQTVDAVAADVAAACAPTEEPADAAGAAAAVIEWVMEAASLAAAASSLESEPALRVPPLAVRATALARDPPPPLFAALSGLTRPFPAPHRSPSAATPCGRRGRPTSPCSSRPATRPSAPPPSSRSSVRRYTAVTQPLHSRYTAVTHPLLTAGTHPSHTRCS